MRSVKMAMDAIFCFNVRKKVHIWMIWISQYFKLPVKNVSNLRQARVLVRAQVRPEGLREQSSLWIPSLHCVNLSHTTCWTWGDREIYMCVYTQFPFSTVGMTPKQKQTGGRPAKPDTWRELEKHETLLFSLIHICFRKASCFYFRQCFFNMQ